MEMMPHFIQILKISLEIIDICKNIVFHPTKMNGKNLINLHLKIDQTTIFL